MSRAEDHHLHPDDVLFVAHIVVTDHAAGHPCQRCGPASCDQLAWARSLVDLAATDLAQFRALAGSW